MKLSVLEQLHFLRDEPPWDWPEGSKDLILRVVRDDRAAEADRLLAVDLAGHSSDMDDTQVEALLAVVQSDTASAELRGQAAIALGPVLEEADTEGFEPPGDPGITEETFHLAEQMLQGFYEDTRLPKEVRRRVLEASVRAPRDWHSSAVAAAYASDDSDWKLTAVFCMHYVRGFDEQILESLDSPNAEIAFEAVRAAGEWSIERAWPHVRRLLTSGDTPKPLLVTAILAAPGISPEESLPILMDLSRSPDEELSEAADEALAFAVGDPDDDGEDECSLCSGLDEDE